MDDIAFASGAIRVGAGGNALEALGYGTLILSRSDLVPESALFPSLQVHGTKVLEVSTNSHGTDSCDGLATSSAYFKIGVRTADCVPILLCSKTNPLCSAIHGGWRGLTQGILDSARAWFASRGSPGRQLAALIGPAISAVPFEVGPEVVSAVYGKSCGLTKLQADRCWTQGQGDRCHVDLQLLSLYQLENFGIEASAVSIDRRCTYRDLEFYSYRREGKVGSNHSLIWIQD
jgi:polyphenol oxidase